LSSVFVIIPPPGMAHRANDCLPAGVDVHVLDGNFLLPLPSIALQCLGLGREGSQKFHSEISVAVLLGYHVRARQTAQRAWRSEMRRNRPVARYWLQNYRFPVARACALGYENYRFSASRAPGVGSANSITPRAKRACSMRVSFGADVGRQSCLRSQKRTARSLTASTVARSRCVMPARVRTARNCRPVTRLLLR
jgi:hypothetical protein